MTVKKVNAPFQVQKGENTPEVELKALPVASDKPEQEPTAEELKQVIEDLNKRLSAIPKDLKTRVEYFSKKNELIRRLSKLDSDKDSLTIHLDRLSEIGAANEFENEEFYLNIETGSSNYSKKAIYTLKNPVIIAELIAFIIGKVDSKRESLKLEIEA